MVMHGDARATKLPCSHSGTEKKNNSRHKDTRVHTQRVTYPCTNARESLACILSFLMYWVIQPWVVVCPVVPLLALDCVVGTSVTGQ